MKQRKIETEEDFKMAMSAVQSSIQLLDMFDWDDWLAKEGLFQTAGAVLDPTMFNAMKKDPQWETKVAVIRAGATFMKTIRDIRSGLEAPDEG